jgi:type IV pilus biogenesis/stability protein PilW
MLAARVSLASAVLVTAALFLASCANVEAVRKEHANGYYRMANAHLQQGRGYLDETNRRKAYAELVQAIQLDPKNADYRLLLGTLFLYSGELISAEREIKKALEYSPDFGDARNNLGLVYVEQGRLGEAVEEFEKAIANYSYRTPEVAYFNLGRSSYLLGNYVEAVDAFGRSLDIASANEEALFFQGRSYVKLGRLSEAATSFSKALKLNPDSVRTHYELGVVLFKLSREEAASSHFEKVVELDPDGEMAEQARTFIKLLR